MERLSFIDKLLKEWIELTPRKQILYILGSIIIVLGVVIAIGARYHTNKITEIENEHTIMVASLNARHDARMAAEQEETRKCNQAFIKYLENNEKEVRELLYRTEKVEQKYNRKKR